MKTTDRTFALYSRFFFILSVFLISTISGCGFNRYHQFVLPDKTSEKSIKGWAITLTLERHEVGISKPVEDYTFVIEAEPTPARRRNRLALDSLGIYGPRSMALPWHQLVFPNEFTDIGSFTREQTGISLPTDIDSLTCRLHVTLLDSKAQKRWHRTIDYVFHSDWRKKLWVFRRK